MKKVWIVFVIAAAGLVSVGLTGCQKEEKTAPQPAVQKAAEQPAAAQPAVPVPAADQKPKDHPAH